VVSGPTNSRSQKRETLRRQEVIGGKKERGLPGGNRPYAMPGREGKKPSGGKEGRGGRSAGFERERKKNFRYLLARTKGGEEKGKKGSCAQHGKTVLRQKKKGKRKKQKGAEVCNFWGGKKRRRSQRFSSYREGRERIRSPTNNLLISQYISGKKKNVHSPSILTQKGKGLPFGEGRKRKWRKNWFWTSFILARRRHYSLPLLREKGKKSAPGRIFSAPLARRGIEPSLRPLSLDHQREKKGEEESHGRIQVTLHVSTTYLH